MSSLLRRLRGLLGTAAIWGAGWFGLSAVGWTVVLFGQVPLGMILSLAAGVGLAGAMAGAGFAVVIGIAERKRRLEDLSFLRFASWGALGGIAVGLPFLGALAGSGSLAVLAILGGLGATSAAGSLALARMGEDTRALSDGREAPLQL